MSHPSCCASLYGTRCVAPTAAPSAFRSRPWPPRSTRMAPPCWPRRSPRRSAAPRSWTSKASSSGEWKGHRRCSLHGHRATLRALIIGDEEGAWAEAVRERWPGTERDGWILSGERPPGYHYHSTGPFRRYRAPRSSYTGGFYSLVIGALPTTGKSEALGAIIHRARHLVNDEGCVVLAVPIKALFNQVLGRPDRLWQTTRPFEVAFPLATAKREPFVVCRWGRHPAYGGPPVPPVTATTWR
jgi:hypothetical protein